MMMNLGAGSFCPLGGVADRRILDNPDGSPLCTPRAVSASRLPPA